MNSNESKKLHAAINADFSNALNPLNWPDPILIDDSSLGRSPALLRSENTDILSQLTMEICKSVQFPVSTGFMHGLGVIASAMNKSFNIEAYPNKFIPANLYVVTSQPASSGKSAINDCFSDPVVNAFRELNKKNAPARFKLVTQIARLEKDMSKADDNELPAIATELMQLKEKLSKVPEYKYKVTNATPQGLERRAGMQGGVWQLISDEAGSINSTLGRFSCLAHEMH